MIPKKQSKYKIIDSIITASVIGLLLYVITGGNLPSFSFSDSSIKNTTWVDETRSAELLFSSEGDKCFLTVPTQKNDKNTYSLTLAF